MARTVFGARLQWVEKTSNEEIMTRSTTDVNKVDEQLPTDIHYMVDSIARVGITLLARGRSSISLRGAFFALGIIYAYFITGRGLMSATRRLRKISANTNASLFSQLTSLRLPDAVLTVRTYGMSSHFMNCMFCETDLLEVPLPTGEVAPPLAPTSLATLHVCVTPNRI
ncbi:hypothetical protein B0H67DRAFT_551519 [Lasiosphaeris hirsuta]|uniref:ABC transmembrane type-1 domain-containing protein n=1 Tax=Lasiosphaeris hirsuta TaxID=260670 RepID=A0AA40B1V6_9PEZI|nr:hypothetical protein B0H67DRAFT_551519 [Lasiosphaeris hirsuta]